MIEDSLITVRFLFRIGYRNHKEFELTQAAMLKGIGLLRQVQGQRCFEEQRELLGFGILSQLADFNQLEGVMLIQGVKHLKGLILVGLKVVGMNLR